MKLDAIRPGYAQMSMRVRADMLNGHATCHGGFIFMLADSAFAFACNSHNFNTVGAGCTIDYLAPGREGDLLIADAVVAAVTRDDTMIGGGAATLELVIERAKVAEALAAVAAESALSIIPTSGTARP